MGSYMNFKNFGEVPPLEGGGGKPPQGSFPLTRQSSIYNLTFDELQSTFSGLGKDFGSMNMDELLKNIWTAEETQGTTSAAPSGGLQRQGSLTLPRTLSQKTVDEVWKDLAEPGTKNTGGGGVFLPQRQHTLGEMTLEEFLLKAGVVREEAQAIGRLNDNGYYGDLLQQKNNNFGLAIGFQQPGQNVNNLAESNNLVPNQTTNLALNMSGIRPPQGNAAFSSPMHLVNSGQLSSPRTRGGNVGVPDISMNGLDQGGGLKSGGLSAFNSSAGAVKVATEPPAKQMRLNVIGKSDVDAPSLSPSPYSYGQSVRGRKGNSTLDKVVERRHKRMIKNRESAARSRARKQAYTIELEEEVAKLKEVNEELQKKQAEIIEMEKTQIMEKMKQQWGGKQLCLRRTLTGPW